MSLLTDDQWRAAFDAGATVLAYWDSGCRNVLANPALARWTGVSVPEVSGLHIREVLGAELYEQARPHIDAVLKGTPQAFERAFTDVDGTVHRVRVEYVPDTIGVVVVGFAAMFVELEPGEPDLSASDVATRLGFCLSTLKSTLKAVHHRLGLPLAQPRHLVAEGCPSFPAVRPWP